MSEALPQSIGAYRVIAKLGQGGMARVMLALKPGPAGFRKLMVIKQLREGIADDPEFLTMFLDEARLAARLDHPNVVHTYEVGEDDGNYFIAMDYLEGQPLNRVLHRIKRRRIATAIHLRILSDALEGLHYAHDLADFDGTPLDVVHRDVSPHNVFITYEGRVQLVDFGIAKAAGASGQTREGVFKGKVSYIAPEQARAETVDRRADLFSLGVMMWEALAGRRLAKGQDDLVTLHRRIEGLEPKLGEVAPDVAPALLAIVDRAMAHDPADRYPTAAAFRDDIEAHLDAEGVRVTTKDVAELLAEHFSAERQALKEKIDQQVKRLEKGERHVSVIEFEATPSMRGEPTPSSTDHREMTTTAPTALSDSATVHAAAAQKPGGPPMWVWGGVAAVCAAGAWLAFGRGEDAPPAAPTPTVSAVASATVAASAIRLKVSVLPKEAVLILDGAKLTDNPFDASVNKDATLHRLRASADGYEPEERMVTFDHDQDIRIDLTAVASDEDAGIDEPPPTPIGLVGRRPPPPSTKTSPPSSTEGMDLTRPAPPPPKRAIDETDPYK
jgi:eukaryotic-like serine/threonine-protein kinase